VLQNATPQIVGYVFKTNYLLFSI